MEQKSTKLSLLLLLFSGMALSAAAQEGTEAAGGDASGSGGTVNYTYGQVSYMSNGSNSTGLASQGVQQTYLVTNGTGLEENPGALANTNLYPNPTSSSVILETSLDEVSCDIYDNSGRLLGSEKAGNGKTVLSTEKLAPGAYLVKVSGNAGSKTFRLIKN